MPGPGPLASRPGRRAAAIVALLAAGVLAAACGSGGETTGGTSATTAPATTATGTEPTPTTAPATTTEPATEPAPSTETEPPATTAPPPEPGPEPGPELPASLVGTEWSTLPTDRRVVGLTFDGGANADGAASILETLAAEGVPATFFLTGRWIEEYPDLAARIGATYPVGNHTATHPHLPELGDAAVRREVRRAERLIVDVAGRDPRPLFRFPYGESDARTIGLVNDLGYGGIRWTIDTLGWKGTSGGQSASTVRRRVVEGVVPGAIVLMHLGSNPDDGSTLDADALPRIVEELRSRGYRFVTVARYT